VDEKDNPNPNFKVFVPAIPIDKIPIPSIQKR